jgi:hypothetical protein
MPYISTQEVAEKRKAIKEAFPNWKFSIVREHYSSLNVCIMEADINLLDDENMERGYQGVNQFYIKDHFQGEVKEKLQQIYDIMREGNRIISEDADYGSIPSFYTNISIGKWDKRFMVVKKEKKEAVRQQPREQMQVVPIVEGKVSIIDY